MDIIEWQKVLLDLVIIADFLIIAYWFHLDLTRRAFTIISLSFLFLAVSRILLFIVVLSVALDCYSIDILNFICLANAYGNIVWRYGAAVGFTVVTYQLMFGRFDDNGR